MHRLIKDTALQAVTFISAGIGVLILALIIGFVFMKGFKVISFDFIFGSYHTTPTWVRIERDTKTFDRPEQLDESIYWSTLWGVGISEDINLNKKEVIVISYIAKESPLKLDAMRYTTTDDTGKTNERVDIELGDTITAFYTDYRMPAKKADNIIEHIDQRDALFLEVTAPAGGISGTIITTLMIIGVTLLIALPFGVFIALYLTEYAKESRIILVMRSMIDMLAGVPSIVYGIVGVFLFFRVFPIGGDRGGYTILGGALTLVAILLPVIIRSTEEALITVPKELRHASLALGANRAQTIAKVVLPSAIPGILTALLLSIGRIVGESAALILVAGTIINDSPALKEGGATLAVHIWKEMAGEQPNIDVAAGIGVLIILMVLVLNILVKLMSRYFNKARI